jgi:imidazolonepropionase-like amidohydrolase
MVTALAAIRAPGLASRRPQAGAATLAELYTPVDRRRGAPSPVREPISLGPFADTLGRLQRSSGRIAIGSDAPAVPYGYGLHLELALLAESGVPNAQVLRWATAAGAMALGLDQQLGTLEPGKLADFVIVDGDPLEEIGDTQRIDAVAKGGVVFTREQLLKVPTG